jgi:hypothetical protein
MRIASGVYRRCEILVFFSGEYEGCCFPEHDVLQIRGGELISPYSK